MYKEQGYKCLIHKPINKDFNEDLIEKFKNKKQLDEDLSDEMDR